MTEKNKIYNYIMLQYMNEGLLWAFFLQINLDLFILSFTYCSRILKAEINLIYY